MTFHIDKSGNSEWREGAVFPHIAKAGNQMGSDDVAGYRAGACPAISIAADEWARRQAIRESLPTDADRAPYRPTVSVDLSQCSTLHRQKAIAAHKHAIATAETDAYAKPVPIKGIDWSIWAFIAAMAMLGICIALGVAMVMS